MAPSFVRRAVRQMDGYTPGEQPRIGERVVKINTNENPYPPSPRVMQAIREIEPEMLRRYPNPTAESFRAAAAKLLDVTPDMIIAGNGSDDILAMATQAALGPGDLLACPDPTYTLYPVLAEISEVEVVHVPWDKNYGLPVDALVATNARAVFVANPNAPTGTFVQPARFEELAKRFDGLVLIDEAYVDFAETNCVSLVWKHENIIVTRSLSKAYSLAGLRFGYVVAQPHVAREIMKVRDSYPCDAISIAAATAAIEDQEYVRQIWQRIRAERERVTAALIKLGWGVLPSQANFILVTCPGGDGEAAYRGLKEQGILVRYFDRPGLTDKIRITIGTGQENDALLAGIAALAQTTVGAGFTRPDANHR